MLKVSYCYHFLCLPAIKQACNFRLSVDESNHDKTVEICKDTNAMEVEGRRVSKIGKCRSRNNKVEYSLDSAADPDGDQHGQGVSTSREEKVSSLKTVSFYQHSVFFSFVLSLHLFS